MPRIKDPAAKQQIIVSVQLAAEAKRQLDNVCDERGMTIKSLLGRLISWFGSIDKTEQSIVLNQVEARDVRTLSEMLMARGGAKATKKPS
ncbi:MAG: hypothetical protein ACKVS9_06780 [Phycisphaerae bacterium]